MLNSKRRDTTSITGNEITINNINVGQNKKKGSNKSPWKLIVEMLGILAGIATIITLVFTLQDRQKPKQAETVPERKDSGKILHKEISRPATPQHSSTAPKKSSIIIKYKGRIVDPVNETARANIKIFCGSCTEQNVVTDRNGAFILSKTHSEPLMAAISISDGSKPAITLTVNLEEQSPEPIKF